MRVLTPCFGLVARESVVFPLEATLGAPRTVVLVAAADRATDFPADKDDFVEEDVFDDDFDGDDFDGDLERPRPAPGALFFTSRRDFAATARAWNSRPLLTNYRERPAKAPLGSGWAAVWSYKLNLSQFQPDS
jgi:hypothetical protein